MADKKTDFKPTYINTDGNTTTPETRRVIDNYLVNFKGANKIQRGGGWELTGSGQSGFLASNVAYSLIPTANNTYQLGSSSYKWSDVVTVKINGVTPQAGTQTVYVAASSGGSPTTAITFNTGIKTG